jgi:predicted secreted protein
MYRDGTNLILGRVVENQLKALGHSTGCKITDNSETAERVTKEQQAEGQAAGWKETYVKTISEQITADGFVFDGDDFGFPELKQAWISRQPVQCRYAYRGEESTHYWQGMYIITSLEQTGEAGDDEKYSITLQNTGPVTRHDIESE